jgi:flagellar motor protein MotB
MSRKPKKPPSKPSKAYLVSFGDTMTALLAFFIVLNSLAKDQTGANMYTGTGSFVQAMKSIGIPGKLPGDRSSQPIDKKAPRPIYAVSAEKELPDDPGRGPDDEDDGRRIINRQAENFQRFLSEMEYQFEITEDRPTKSQVVFDSFENLVRDSDSPLGPNALQLAADSISQLSNADFELEIVVWANMPSPRALSKAMKQATLIHQQLERSFHFRGNQGQRLSTSAKPWLFVDAKRPRISFILSRLDDSQR